MDILGRLQQKIQGIESPAFTPSEIKIFWNQKRDENFFRVYYRALQEKVIDPTTTLLEALLHIDNEDDILLIALPLRFGANENLYVNAEGIGAIHVLAFIYEYHQAKVDKGNLRNLVAELFLLKNSSPGRAAIDPTGGREGTSTRATVIQYLRKKGFSVELLEKERDVRPTKRHAILLDDPELLSEALTADDRQLIVRSFAQQLWEKYDLATQLYDPPGMLEAIHYYNREVYMTLNDVGCIPSYLLMSKMLNLLVMASKKNNKIIEIDLTEMFFGAIKNGATIDVTQQMFVNQLDIVERFRAEYEKPYWKKACSSNRKMASPVMLRRQAYELGLDPKATKEYQCNALEKMDRAEPAAVIEAAKNANRALLVNPDVIDYLNGSTEDIAVNNYGDGDIFDRPPDQVVTFRNRNGNFSAYDIQSYDQLLQRKTDIMSNQVLSSELLNEIQAKRNDTISIQKELFYRPEEYASLRVSDAVAKLSTPDKPHQLTGYLYHFEQELLANDISRARWESLTDDQLRAAMKGVRFPIDSSREYSLELLRNSVAVAYLTILSVDQKRRLLEELKQFRK